jgi:YidC/Oxa1 family membrane protein insertase
MIRCLRCPKLRITGNKILEDRRNLIIAVLLTVLVIFGWPIVAEKIFPQPPVIAKPAATAAASAATAANTSPTADTSVPSAKAQALTLSAALSNSPRVLIDTPKLKGSINLQGARIDDLLLLAHRVDLAKDSPPVRLFAPSGTKGSYFARFGWKGEGIIAPDESTVWTANARALTPTTPVTLSWTNPTNQTFEIALSIDKDYLVTAEQRFTNNGPAAAKIATYGLISRNGKSLNPDTWNIHVGPMGVFNDEIVNVNYDEVEEAPKGELVYKTKGGWLGVTEQYWLAALIPAADGSVTGKFQVRDGIYQTVMIDTNQADVGVGTTSKHVSRLFAGAKEVNALTHYANKENIKYLDYSIDWGWFWFIEKPFFTVLHWLFGVFGNFGWAIIGLTFIVRLVMFPIAQRQFASMAQMRAVQPKMKELQERYKDDKPKMQQETMKLYKDEKVNPLAGCLPILLQIPIFFALYKLLMLTIEMRHQPFYLWLKDLSAPDPSTALLFQSIGITLPAFLAIGVLPILLGVTMWLMQKLNPQPMDDVQKQVFAIMPWMMMFLFASLGAGLQLYYVVSNTLTIFQQKWLYSKHPILKQQMAKDAEDKEKNKALAKG